MFVSFHSARCTQVASRFYCISYSCSILDVSTYLSAVFYWCMPLLSVWSQFLCSLMWHLEASDWFILRTAICAATIGREIHVHVNVGYRYFQGVAVLTASSVINRCFCISNVSVIFFCCVCDDGSCFGVIKFYCVSCLTVMLVRADVFSSFFTHLTYSFLPSVILLFVLPMYNLLHLAQGILGMFCFGYLIMLLSFCYMLNMILKNTENTI